MRALFIGRFQPFHNGHLKTVEWILGRYDDLVIAIGSTQHAYEPNNLFTTGERVEMILDTLRANRISDRCAIIPVSDINNHALWVSHVNSLVPSYDVAFSNNPLVKRLFSSAGIRVEDAPLFQKNKYDGTTIRALMLKKGKWKPLVPKEVAEFIDRVKGVKRLGDISKMV